MYLTYTDYKNMGGTLDSTTFDNFEFEAGTVIDWYTFGRLHKFDTLPEAVQRCSFKIISILQQRASAVGEVTGVADAASYIDENNDGQIVVTASSSSSSGTSSMSKSVASYSNDGVSVSFNTLSAKDTLDYSDAEIKNCIQMYLGTVLDSLGRRVLYRGIYPDE